MGEEGPPSVLYKVTIVALSIMDNKDRVLKAMSNSQIGAETVPYQCGLRGLSRPRDSKYEARKASGVRIIAKKNNQIGYMNV